MSFPFFIIADMLIDEFYIRRNRHVSSLNDLSNHHVSTFLWKNFDNGLQLSLVNYQMKKELFWEKHKQLKLGVEQIL